MKKLLSVLAVATLVFTLSGNALAAFNVGTESGSLILSISNETSTEYGIELDTAMSSSFDWSANNVELLSAGSIDYETLFGSDYSSLIAGIYSTSGSLPYYYEVVGLAVDTEIVTATTQAIAFTNNVKGIVNYYGTDATSVEVDPSSIKSYTTALSNGSYGGLLPEANSSYEVTLDDLATVGYVDVYMYVWNILEDVSLENNTSVATIRLYADGSAVLNAVPVPAAVWLLGSGLLGLIGIRRNRTAA